jgi:hypothetical protein
MKRIRERVHDLTSAGDSEADLQQMVAKVDPVLPSRGDYFWTREVQSDRRLCLPARAALVVSARRAAWPYKRLALDKARLWTMGVHRLEGPVLYPAQATPRRSSLGRVQETRTHGLKGGHMETARLH